MLLVVLRRLKFVANFSITSPTFIWIYYFRREQLFYNNSPSIYMQSKSTESYSSAEHCRRTKSPSRHDPPSLCFWGKLTASTGFTFAGEKLRKLPLQQIYFKSPWKQHAGCVVRFVLLARVPERLTHFYIKIAVSLRTFALTSQWKQILANNFDVQLLQSPCNKAKCHFLWRSFIWRRQALHLVALSR